MRESLQRRTSESLRDRLARERDDLARARGEVCDRRDETAEARDRAADLGDARADARDAAADLRDRASDERDSEADRVDRRAEGSEAAARPPLDDDVLDRLRTGRRETAAHRRESADDRRLNAEDRRDSALDRSSARADRIAAARDREAGRVERRKAEADRAAAEADRDASASDREAAHLDELTGAYRRGSGFVELEREMARAVRAHQPLAVAFVDVDHLKQVNDSQGHAAGDQLLRHVAGALIARLRDYDMVIRYGGDEFVAVMNGLSAEAATARLRSINTVLRTMSSGASMSIGVSELQPGDSAEDVVRRADEALYRARSARG
jgi:diguanylate cyclase (GGDEF)-like protein